jgi:Malectin domain
MKLLQCLFLLPFVVTKAAQASKLRKSAPLLTLPDETAIAVVTPRTLQQIDPPPQPPQEPYTIRISTGSTEAWTDDLGITWEQDNYHDNNGAIYSKCPMEIDGTTLDTIFCKERYFNKWQHKKPFHYEIPVPRNGAYAMKLHFAEIHYQAVGKRVFGVWVNGKLAIRKLDIFAEVGFATALTIPIATLTNNGKISIELVGAIENPKICAIEIVEVVNVVAPPTEAPTVQPFSTRISAGATENWVDDNDVTWESDKYFNNKGAVHWLCPLQINGTELDNLYCKERYFNPWTISL